MCVLGVMVERTHLQLQTAWVEVLAPPPQCDLGRVIEVLCAFKAFCVLGGSTEDHAGIWGTVPSERGPCIVLGRGLRRGA